MLLRFLHIVLFHTILIWRLSKSYFAIDNCTFASASESSFSMAIITLTTDLGTKDYYVGKLKGCILTHNPSTSIVDISHVIPLHDIAKAAHFARASHQSFGPGTIHVLHVYSAYNSSPVLLLYTSNDQHYILPNNGLISLIFDTIDSSQVREILPHPSSTNTFDLIGHVCACIKNGLIEECSKPIGEYNQKISVQPVIGPNEIRGTIIHIDHMENVVTNISRDLFDTQRNGRRYEIYFRHNEPITQLSTSYSDVAVGEVLCMFNDSNMLELAINMGKASSLLHLYDGETIQIYFL